MKVKSNGRLSERPQLNFRVEEKLKQDVEAEIRRQGRKRDAVCARVWRWFLSHKPGERDSICGGAA